MELQDKKNLYKVRETVLEMIQDRGYTIPDIEKISFEEFIIKYNNKNINIYINDIEKNKNFYVHFHNETKSFGKSDLSIIQKIVNQYNDPDITFFLILKDKENSAVSKELTKDAYKNVEIFLKKNLIFNITHHVYVPKHEILSKEEEVRLLETYNTTKGKLPKISKADPIAKYYGMKNEQICKITRKSPEVGEYVYYRLVR
jgi:DNA-directed RNA polymerase I, II, and III subunit RPABC1